MLLTRLLPFPVVVCFLLLSLPAGVAGSGAVESGSVVGSLLLPPCSCSTPSATVATSVTSPIAIITVIIIINITIYICTIFHSVYSNIIFTVCTSMCILCRLPPSALSLSLSLALSLPLTPNRSRQMAAHPEPWFCSRFLPLKRKFFLACVA